MLKPIKRHVAIQPVSREHHHGLLLSWKIREGFRLHIEPQRIKDYVNWFWMNHLESHFKFEEAFIFPILGSADPLVKRALLEHDRLKALFASKDNIEGNLSMIEEELVAHIRFEERVLFNEIQQIASELELRMIEEEHSKNVVEEWDDAFWIKE